MCNFNKSFNPIAFGKYIDSLPKYKKSELLKSEVLKKNNQIKNAFSSKGGSGYAILPMYGKIEGKAINYDGVNDIIPNATKTFQRGVVVIGRANAWVEDDFYEDINGGVSFMSNVARQVSEYFDEVDQSTLISILKGIFLMSGGKNDDFVSEHTLDISSNSAAKANLDVTTLNSAIQKACGDNKSKFSVVIMHSVVATNLENLNILNYARYTDPDGIQRDLGLATLNGKAVIIDDSLPVDDGKYTTYVLGKGAIDFQDVGTKVPFEIHRDPKVNGGQSTLYARTRKCFAPFGISYLKASQVTLSPTNEELANGTNWSLVKDDSDNSFIEHKTIPIARIISKG